MFSLDSTTWIAIYMPFFALFFIVFPQQREMRKLISVKTKKRKGAINMTNEIIKKNIGNNCKISTGSFGTSVTGKIIDIKENWIEIETKKGYELINADFIQSIKILGQ